MMMWHDALAQMVVECRDKKPNWGEIDCCQFAARYVFLLTGKDYSDGFTYSNKREAMQLLEAHGGLEGLFKKFLGTPQPPEPGSLVVSDGTTGVWNGSYIIGITHDGLMRFLSPIDAAWTV